MASDDRLMARIVGGLAHWLANFFNWSALRVFGTCFWVIARARKPKTAPGPTEALVRRQKRAQEEATSSNHIQDHTELDMFIYIVI